MRDNRFINMSGINDQWIGVDMNIERLDNFSKVTGFATRDYHICLFAFRRGSRRRELTRPRTTSVIFQSQVTLWTGAENDVSWFNAQTT